MFKRDDIKKHRGLGVVNDDIRDRGLELVEQSLVGAEGAYIIDEVLVVANRQV